MLCGSAFLLAFTLQASDPAPGVWESRNPGGGGWFERIEVGPDGTLVACSDLSGAYLSRDRGVSWEIVGASRGLTVTHVASAGFAPSDADRLCLGTDDGIFRSVDGGASFDSVHAGGYVEHIAFSPGNPARAYAAWHPFWNSNNGRVLRSIDGGASWQDLGSNLPAGHRVIELRVAPDAPNRVYALTGAGRFAAGPKNLFRSDDGGVSFSEVGAALGGRVIDVALDPFDADALYASVESAVEFELGYVWRSTDRGANWNLLSRRSGFLWPHTGTPGVLRMVSELYQFPWLSELEGIWESTAGGAAGSWVQTASVTDFDDGWSDAFWAHQATSAAGGFAADPSDPDALFWVNSQFVYGSLDGGRSVQALHTDAVAPGSFRSTGVDNIVVTDLAAGHVDPDELYAALFDMGVWRSPDGGASWIQCNLLAFTGSWQGAGGTAWTIACDPDRAGVVWAPQAGDREDPSTMLKSTDAGATWSVQGASQLPAAPLLGLSIDPNSPTAARTLFVTADGDVWRGSNDGSAWSLALAQGGLRTTAVDEFDGGIVYAGGESGFWRSFDGGATWAETGLPAMRGNFPGEPFWGWEGVYDIEADPLRPGWVYVAATGVGKGLWRSRDFGVTWDPQLLTDDFAREVLASRRDPQLLFVSTSSAYDSGGYDPGSRGVLRSTDGGASWIEVNGGLAWPFALPLADSAAAPDVLWTGSPGSGIARRDFCADGCGTGWLAEPYLSGCAGTGGLQPQIGAVGLPSSPGGTVGITVQDALPNSVAFLVYSTAYAWIPLSPACVLRNGASGVGPAQPIGPAGGATLAVPLTANLFGQQLFGQYVCIDPGGAYQNLASLSPGLNLILGL